MKRTIAAFVLLLAIFTVAIPAMAQDAGAKPVQLALVNPVQLFPAKYSVSGIRINLLYGKNVNVTGLDWGLVNHTTGDFTGIGLAGVSIVEGNGMGLQWGWVNLTSNEMTGFQYGIYNSAGQMTGLQLGWINNAGSIKGLQLGLVNVIHKGGMLPFFPIFNVGVK